jgi:hypothetical protein
MVLNKTNLGNQQKLVIESLLKLKLG